MRKILNFASFEAKKFSPRFASKRKYYIEAKRKMIKIDLNFVVTAEQHIRAKGCSAILVYPTADILSTVRVFPGISSLHSNTLPVRECELEEVLWHCGI